MSFLKWKSFALIASTSLLAACGSGGGSEGAGQIDAARHLIAKYENADITSVMPTKGTATYHGVAAYAYAQDLSNASYKELAALQNLSPQEVDKFIRATSDVALTADFEAASVKGKLNNFQTTAGGLDGSVNVNAKIKGSSFDGTLNGTVGGAAASGNLAGAFIGEGAEAMAGALGAKLDGTQYIGLFGAEK